MKKLNYLEIISIKYPKVYAYDNSLDGSVYEHIKVSQDSPEPLPSKEQLDADIAYQIKLDMWEAIKEERNRRTQGGVKVNYQATDYWFHSDNTSRIQQLALVMLGVNIPPGTMWKTMGGQFVELSSELVQAVYQASIQSDMAKFQAAEIHKANMLASAEPENYDFSQGWPEIYDGNMLSA